MSDQDQNSQERPTVKQEHIFVIDVGEMALVGEHHSKTQLCTECFLRKPSEQFEDAGSTCIDCRNEM